MSSFAEVVKQLKQNKVSQDDGFVRVESALGVTGAKSLQEEKDKNATNIKNKELTYLQKMGDEVGLLNKNFKDLTKALKTPEGIAGGLLGLLVSPFAIVFGFFTGVIQQFLALQKAFLGKNPAWVIAIKDFFKNFKKGFAVGELRKAFPTSKEFQTLAGKVGANVRVFIDFISKPFVAFSEFVKKNKTIQSIVQGIKDTMGIFEKAFNKSGFFKGIFDTVNKVFNLVISSSGLIGKLFGRIVTLVMIPFMAIQAFINEDRGIGARVIKAIGSVGENLVNIFILGIPELLKMLLSWVAGKLGFKSIEKFLDKISFTEIFSTIVRAVEEVLIDLGKLFSFNLSPSEFMKTFGRNFGKGSALDKLGGKLIEAFGTLFTDIGNSIVTALDSLIIEVGKLLGFDISSDFSLKKMVNDAVKNVGVYFTDLFKFEEGSTASIVKKFFGDALDKLGNVFSKLLDSLIKLARNILPESAQKLLGIEMTDGEKKLKKQIETQEKINELEKRISLEQTKINKSLFGEKQYGLTGETTGIRGSNTKITRAQENINALKLDLNPIQNTIETVKKEVVPVVNRFDNQFEARANEIKQAELQKLAFGNSPNMNVVSSVDNSSIITNNGGGGSPIIASVNPDTVISRATSYAT